MEKIQMTAFCVQEFLISAIYIRAIWLRLPGFHDKGRKRILKHLFIVNVIIICLDLALLGVEYAGLYTIEVMLKSSVYSIKLKLEFSILGQLIELVRPGAGREYGVNVSRDRDPARTQSFASPVSPMFGDGMREKCDRSQSVPAAITKTTEFELSWVEVADGESVQGSSSGTAELKSPMLMSPHILKSHSSDGSFDVWNKPHAV